MDVLLLLFLLGVMCLILGFRFEDEAVAAYGTALIIICLLFGFL